MASNSKKMHRSPSYPGLTLSQAIEKARIFYDLEGRHPVPVSAAVAAWGYSPKSSGGRTTIAALKAYGLMDDQGNNEEREVFLTQEGLQILLDERPNSKERAKRLRKAAMQPKIISALLDKYSVDVPSQATLRFFLLSQMNYNPNSVNDIIEVYEDAIQYIKQGLTTSNDLEEAEDVEGLQLQDQEQSDEQANLSKEIRSIDFDSIIKKMRKISDSRDQSEPSDEQAPKAATPGSRTDTFTLDEGVITITYPANLSEESFQDLTDWLVIQHRKIGRSVPHTRNKPVLSVDRNLQD